MTLYSGEMSGKFDICKGQGFAYTTAHKMKYQFKRKKNKIFWSSEIIFQQPTEQNVGKKIEIPDKIRKNISDNMYKGNLI